MPKEIPMTRHDASILFAALLAFLPACGGPTSTEEDEEQRAIPDAGAVSCQSEADADFCRRLGKQCALVKDADNCGVNRAVICGTCPAGEACGVVEANQCGPAPEEHSCVDHLDGDGDGLTDCEDEDCADHTDCTPPPSKSCSRQPDCGDIVNEMVTDVCLAGRCQAPGEATWSGEAITSQMSIRLVFGGALTGQTKPRSSVLRFVDSRRPDGSTLTCAQLQAIGNCHDMSTRSRIDTDPGVNQVFRSVYALDFSTCIGTECVFPNIFATVPRGQGFLLYGEAWYGSRELNNPTGQCASVFCAEGQAVQDGAKVQVIFR